MHFKRKRIKTLLISPTNKDGNGTVAHRTHFMCLCLLRKCIRFRSFFIFNFHSFDMPCISDDKAECGEFIACYACVLCILDASKVKDDRQTPSTACVYTLPYATHAFIKKNAVCKQHYANTMGRARHLRNDDNGNVYYRITIHIVCANKI